MTYQNAYLDHVIWICDHLERGVRRFEALTGIAARFGGRHASGLTHNALASLGPRCYMEILAPTGPASAADDDWCRLARDAAEPRLLTFCMRSPRPLAELAANAHALGCSDAAVAGNARTTPEGVQLRWQWIQPRRADFGLAFPFFIDWLDSPHPAQRIGMTQPVPSVRLLEFAVGHPQAVELDHLLTQLGTPVDTYAAPGVEFRLRLETPLGIVSL